jgi:hypothetical protein
MKPKGIGGVPLTYTEELGEEICLVVATNGKGLEELCRRNKHWPNPNTIYEWRIKVKEFGEKYMKAKSLQVECLVEQVLDISDDRSSDSFINDEGKVVRDNVSVNRARLQVDTRKWFAARLAPKLYGDRIQHEAEVGIKHEDAIKDLK